MHRPGHIDGSGDGTESMDRRKYLGTLAAGAALGAIAVGVESCSTESDDGGKNVLRQWGRITLFDSDVLTIADAEKNRPREGDGKVRIQIPFFNNTGTVIKPGDLVGVHLLKIGCPKPEFIVAINIEELKDHTLTPDEEKVYKNRIANQNKLLRSLNYEKPWTKPIPELDCPEAPKDWDYQLPDSLSDKYQRIDSLHNQKQ